MPADHYPKHDDPIGKWKEEIYRLLWDLKIATNFAAWNNTSRDEKMEADAGRLLKLVTQLPIIRKAGPGAHLGQ